jgi:uncharacterized membrane protein
MRTVMRATFCDRSGATAIFTALMMTTMLGFVGLGVDAALWLQLRAATQGIADNAATAAAMSDGDAREEALAMAAVHGLIDGSNGVTVTGGWRKSGSGGAAVFDVIISRPTPMLFARAFIDQTSGLQVRATAAPDPACAGKPDKSEKEGKGEKAEKADKHDDVEKTDCVAQLVG